VLALAAALVITIVPVAGAQTSGDDSGGQTIELQAFNDTAGSVFKNAIDWLDEQGITQGCNPPANTLFCPNDFVTRGQMAIFLARAFNLPTPGADYFVDDTGKVYEGAANRLFEAGLTVGCSVSPRRFCGDDNIQRDEMAAFLARALRLPPTTENPFSDDNGSTFENAINKIAAAEITVGCNTANTLFCPNQNVTRGQMAAFIRRSLSANAVCAGATEIPAAQCAALIGLYESTAGSGWVNNTGWLLGDPCSWFGVTCAGGSVTSLNMPDNNLAGPIPTGIGALSGLTSIILDGNALSGPLPSQVGSLANLVTLDLSGNLLTTVPAALGNLKSLTLLDLDKNLLAGALPTELGGMTAIVEINMFENSLSGAIPASLGNLATLSQLDLSVNQLSGAIPAFTGTPALTDLDLSNNNLNGAIPATLANLAQLTDLDLSFNVLDGQIPDGFATLPPLLESLDLSSNTLNDNEIPALNGHGGTLVELLLNTNTCLGTSVPATATYVLARDPAWIDCNPA
jgi:hypothetical protein